MCFIVYHGDTSCMERGYFEAGSSFGIIKLNKLCCICIAWMADFQKSINIKMKILSPQKVSSQTVRSRSSETKLYTSQNSNNYSNSPSLSQGAVYSSFCGATKDQKEVMQTIAPSYKYEGMFVLPKYHSALAEWTGVYSIYFKIPAWKMVCLIFYPMYFIKFTYISTYICVHNVTEFAEVLCVYMSSTI